MTTNTSVRTRANFVLSSLLFVISRLETLKSDAEALAHVVDAIPSEDSWLAAIKEHCPEANLARISKRAAQLEKENNPS